MVEICRRNMCIQNILDEQLCVLTIYARPKELPRQVVDGRNMVRPDIHVVYGVPGLWILVWTSPLDNLPQKFQLQRLSVEVPADVGLEQPASEGALDGPRMRIVLELAWGEKDHERATTEASLLEGM